MYCHQCGIYNANEAALCQVCEADLANAPAPENVQILTDLGQFPYTALLLHSFKHMNVLLALIFIPFITLSYLIKKVARMPFLSPSLNSRTPKTHITSLEHIRKLHKKSLNPVSSFLQQQGFETFIDLEDVSMTQGNIQHITVNRQHNIFGTVYINKASGKVSYMSFAAYMNDNSFLSVDNIHALPIRTPKQVVTKHLPNSSIETTYNEFLHTLEQMPGEPVTLSLKTFLQNNYKLRTFIIAKGLQQHLLYTKGAKKQPTTSVCYHHSFNAAVRTCSVCKTALCEACYTEYQDAYYCQNCLPEEVRSAEEQVISEEERYAGLGVRTVAALLDFMLMVLFVTAVYFGLSYGSDAIISEAENSFFPILMIQFIAVLSTIVYFTVPLAKYGRTPGQKVLGLRIIDHHGELPGTVAVIVRLAYHIFAGLFIFPLLGYLFIPFRTKKQGLHDQLAETFVVTKHATGKALLSWTLLLGLCGLIGWQAFEYRGMFSWLSFLSAPFAYNRLVPKITLKAQWTESFEQEENRVNSFISRGERCIVSTNTSLQALDMHTGDIVWTVNNISGVTIQGSSENPALPLLALQYHADDRWTLLNLNPDSGAIKWQQTLKGSHPQMMFDAHTILVYGERGVSAYDKNGTLLWKKQFQGRLMLDYVYLHTGILLGRYSESSLTLLYLDRHTGETLWEKEQSAFYPGHVLGNDRQFFSLDEGKTILMDVSEMTPLWDVPQNIGYVLAHDDNLAKVTRTNENKNIMPQKPSQGSMSEIYAYTATEAIHAADGRVLFSYPPGSRFAGRAVTHDYVLVLRETKTQQNDILLLDKYTGAVRHTLQDRPWYFVFYLSEDDSTIYLAANLKPEGQDAIEIVSELLLLDKQTFTFTEIPVGTNIGSLRFHVFAEENLVFIPSFQIIGGYKIHDNISTDSF